MTYKYINLDYLDTISSGDDSTRRMLLEMVQTEMNSVLSQMRQAYRDGNWPEFHHIAHQLKSTLAFIGNPELTLANQSILSHLEDEDYAADYELWLAVFERLSDPVLQELHKEMSC
jgi:HPt (histidine-containing phosphotransfer) domain-containing protein